VAIAAPAEMHYILCFGGNDMGTLSLRLPDELLSDVDTQAREMGVGRAEYVRQALVRMKQENEKARLRRRLQEASLKVQAESMAVNAEFSAFETDPRA
jgi:metal-responsive CopG/Arc/MetJ family transcriptional regulator